MSIGFTLKGVTNCTEFRKLLRLKPISLVIRMMMRIS